MKVGILSPSSLLRHGLAALLSAHHEISVCWQVDDVHHVHQGGGAGAERPDVILLDSETDALDRGCIQQVKAQFPASKVVVLYEAPPEALIVETLLAGARGCLSKVRDGAVFVKAISCVARDELWADRRLMARALQKGARLNGHPEAENGRLSEREWEVFSLVAVGKRNREIAGALSISEQTVKRHLYSIYRKLNVPSRLEAGLLFYRMHSPGEKAASQAIPARKVVTPKLHAAPGDYNFGS